MIGDGVNDVFVLKKVNIGIVMGIIGIEVFKNVVFMIFVDDNFFIIVKVIIIGRNVYRNIKNVIGFLFLGNIVVIFVVLYLLLVNLLVIFFFV